MALSITPPRRGVSADQDGQRTLTVARCLVCEKLGDIMNAVSKLGSSSVLAFSPLSGVWQGERK